MFYRQIRQQIPRNNEIWQLRSQRLSVCWRMHPGTEQSVSRKWSREQRCCEMEDNSDGFNHWHFPNGEPNEKPREVRAHVGRNSSIRLNCAQNWVWYWGIVAFRTFPGFKGKYTGKHPQIHKIYSYNNNYKCLISFFQTVVHGFPFQPTSMAFDPVQHLLAIGSKSGSLRMYPFQFTACESKSLVHCQGSSCGNKSIRD